MMVVVVVVVADKYCTNNTITRLWRSAAALAPTTSRPSWPASPSWPSRPPGLRASSACAPP
eukprot:16428743-Heterocapsa_arctica.AAC.1